MKARRCSKVMGVKNTAAAHLIKWQFTAKILWLKKYNFLTRGKKN